MQRTLLSSGKSRSPRGGRKQIHSVIQFPLNIPACQVSLYPSLSCTWVLTLIPVDISAGDHFSFDNFLSLLWTSLIFYFFKKYSLHWTQSPLFSFKKFRDAVKKKLWGKNPGYNKLSCIIESMKKVKATQYTITSHHLDKVFSSSALIFLKHEL